MTYGFKLSTNVVESITVTGEEDKFFEQTFDNLKDARKAAALGIENPCDLCKPQPAATV